MVTDQPTTVAKTQPAIARRSMPWRQRESPMVPRYIEFVAQLSKTPSSGTVRKVELRTKPLNEPRYPETG